MVSPRPYSTMVFAIPADSRNVWALNAGMPVAPGREDFRGFISEVWHTHGQPTDVCISEQPRLMARRYRWGRSERKSPCFQHSSSSSWSCGCSASSRLIRSEASSTSSWWSRLSSCCSASFRAGIRSEGNRFRRPRCHRRPLAVLPSRPFMFRLSASDAPFPCRVSRSNVSIPLLTIPVVERVAASPRRPSRGTSGSRESGTQNRRQAAS